MKKKSMLLVLAVLALGVFVVTQTAYAGAAPTTSGCVPLYIAPSPPIPGSSDLHGTMTVYFMNYGTDVYYVVRLAHGNNVDAFQGSIAGADCGNLPPYYDVDPITCKQSTFTPNPGSLEYQLISAVQEYGADQGWWGTDTPIALKSYFDWGSTQSETVPTPNFSWIFDFVMSVGNTK